MKSIRPVFSLLCPMIFSVAVAQQAPRERIQRQPEWGASPVAVPAPATAPATVPLPGPQDLQRRLQTPQRPPAATFGGAPAQRLIPASWEQVPGCAGAITAAAAEVVYVTGCDWFDAAGGGGSSLYRWNGQAFQPHPAGGIGRDITSFAGSSYVIGGDGRLYASYADERWQALVLELRDLDGGLASDYARFDDLAVGAAGLWAVLRVGRGDSRIYRAQTCGGGSVAGGTFCRWEKVGNDSAEDIAVGKAVWIAAYGQVYRWDDHNPERPWQSVPGCARDLAANGDHVYAIGCDALPGEDPLNQTGELLRWNGRGWSRSGQRGRRVAVDAAGRPWIVAGDGSIWRRSLNNGRNADVR